MPYWTPPRLEAAVVRLLAVTTARRALRRTGSEAGFSTAEGLAGAALAVVALIAIWAAMRAFGVNIIHWMQDQITTSGGGTGGP
jgi:hypothetical protein